jgi:hypothetical protein
MHGKHELNYLTQGSGDISLCSEGFGDIILLDTSVVFTRFIRVTPTWIVRI